MKNKIWGILDEDEKWTEEAEDIERMFCEYFATLFSSIKPSQAQMEAALQEMPVKVTKEMNEMLDQPFSKNEIVASLAHMCPTKAPSPDGFPAVFFQKHWKAVSEGVLATCMHILNDGGSITLLNHTLIALIPKVKKPRKVTKYRPISLCNVINRIVAKTIANRLKQILHSIIATTPSAFVPNRELSITHLLFADDSLIFAKANTDECINLNVVFDCYAAAFGHIFNYEKSSMFFSRDIPARQIDTIKDIFQCQVVSRHEKYLGLPSMVGKKKISFFNDIKLRVLSKISSWTSKLFSSGGKEVLIKAVAQAVPTYAMSVFKLPLGLCEDIQQAFAGFWWGSKKEQRHIHWARWEKLCSAKGKRGLGFKDLSSFNQALVANQS
ncbi:hypothetical protein KPL70_003399 [Citrus sinensis]|nr:hypothetical protein KPL70_003399 [Citrus sinensis]